MSEEKSVINSIQQKPLSIMIEECRADFSENQEEGKEYIFIPTIVKINDVINIFLIEDDGFYSIHFMFSELEDIDACIHVKIAPADEDVVSFKKVLAKYKEILSTVKNMIMAEGGLFFEVPAIELKSKIKET